jgi:hypothetical protein
METLSIQGMTAPKPMKKLPSSTTSFANNKVITGGITNPTRKVIRISIPIIIQINLPSKAWF